MNRILKLVLLFAITITCGSAIAQDSKDAKKEEIKHLIDSKKYVFVAQTALPLNGRNVNLTSLFDLRVSGDTIVSELPYFGVAYVAPLSPNESGIRFNSTNNNYTVKQRKKGGWEISLSPKNSPDIREMFLRVSESGYASLQVINTNKQGISFYGYLTSLEGKL